jgi:hypothetical protein
MWSMSDATWEVIFGRNWGERRQGGRARDEIE